VLKGLKRYDPKRPLRPYVLGVARRVGIELCRKRRAAGDAAEVADPSAGAAEQVERAERSALVGAALAALPDEQRTLLALRHVSELSMQELADGLECSLPTARARLREAKVGFARQLRARGVVPGGAP
jgi:RNA polymerase sigma-70 factor (ECF subfamily)